MRNVPTYPTRYPANVIPFRRVMPRAALGDFSSVLTGVANIASQVNSIFSGSPTSVIYNPTTIPLSGNTSVSSSLTGLMPYVVIGGVLYLLMRKR